MKKLIIITALACLPLKAVLAADYSIDPGHTYVSFAINHLGFSTMRGKFDRQSGSMQFDPAAKKASVMIEIDATSIDTGHDKRDAHLQSPDFLNAVVNELSTTAPRPHEDGLWASHLHAQLSGMPGMPSGKGSLKKFIAALQAAPGNQAQLLIDFE